MRGIPSVCRILDGEFGASAVCCCEEYSRSPGDLVRTVQLAPVAFRDVRDA